MKKAIILIILEILILTYFISSVEAKTAPGLALYNLDGKLVTLSNLIRENNIIITFWASYCRPCRNEIPQLISLEKKYAEKKNIKLILINIDKIGKAKVESSLDEIGVSSECLLDPYQVVVNKYVTGLKIPAVFLITKSGEIFFESIGDNKENIDNLEKSIMILK